VSSGLARATSFEQEPGAPLGLVNPILEQACAGHVSMLVAQSVRLTHEQGLAIGDAMIALEAPHYCDGLVLDGSGFLEKLRGVGLRSEDLQERGKYYQQALLTALQATDLLEQGGAACILVEARYGPRGQGLLKRAPAP
jgi:hypothetical protein